MMVLFLYLQLKKKKISIIFQTFKWNFMHKKNIIHVALLPIINERTFSCFKIEKKSKMEIICILVEVCPLQQLEKDWHLKI
jgi:hypothetical protein